MLSERGLSEIGHPMRYTLSNEKHDLKHDFPPIPIKEKTCDTSSARELPIGEIQSEPNSLVGELLGGTALVPSLAGRRRRLTGDSPIRRLAKRRQQEADNMKTLPKAHDYSSKPDHIERDLVLKGGSPAMQDPGRVLEHPETTYPCPDLHQPETSNANRDTILHSVSNRSMPPKTRTRAETSEERGGVHPQRPRMDETTGEYTNTVRAMPEEDRQEEDIHESDIRIITDSKFIGHQAFYLVIWCDTSRERSWEPYSRLQACSRSVARYHKQDPFALPP